MSTAKILRRCDFCGSPIEPGTGVMYVRSDGTIHYYCSSKCFKNAVKLKRKPEKVRWTERYAELKRRRLGRNVK